MVRPLELDNWPRAVVSGVTEEEGAFRHVWCGGAPVDCCHCLTEILYLYDIELIYGCSGKFRVYSITKTITVSNTCNN